MALYFLYRGDENMAIKINNSFVTEKIEDENGNKIGEIKFNPNDSRIMAKLSKIIDDLGKALKEIDSIGDIPKIEEKDLKSIEDFEKMASTFEKISKGFNIEEKAVDNVINDLSEIFGKETIELFTGGTKDIISVMPLIEYVIPFVKKSREGKVNKYISKNNNGVME